MVVVLRIAMALLYSRMFVLVGIEFCDESFYPQGFGQLNRMWQTPYHQRI